MRAIKIKIDNLRAFKSFEADLPSVAIISGSHGVGKSSLEEILKYALGRRPLADKGSRGVEHDPLMLHMGAERGEAVISFDETSAIELLRVVVTRDSTKREIKTRGGKKWIAASAEIDAFAEAISYDPMSLKTMTARERVQALLKVMPIEVSAQEITQAMNGIGVSATIFKLPPSLDAINAAYADIESQRRDVNRDAKSLLAHAAELESALPPASADGQDWTAKAAEADQRIAALKKSESDTILRLSKQVGEVRTRAASDTSVKHADIDADINSKIAALERERESRKSLSSKDENKIVDAVREAANKEVTEIREAIAPEVSRLTTEAAEARTQAEAQQRTAGARSAAEKARTNAAEKEKQSEKMTEAMDRLIALKKEVAGRMKVPGLTIESPGPGMETDACRVEDGKLVPFSIFNDSDKDLTCLRIAVIARGSYGLVCVDDISGYLPERREKVIAAAKAYSASAGMQFIFGEAVDGPLEIKDGLA